MKKARPSPYEEEETPEPLLKFRLKPRQREEIRDYEKSPLQERGSLSVVFKDLDDEEEERHLHPESVERRGLLWPEVDAAVFEWERRMLKKNSYVSNAQLKAMARKVYAKLPENNHDDEQSSPFSDGWLRGYKVRYEVQNTLLRPDKPGVPGAVQARQEKERIAEELSGYASENIYSMDETSLFWKLSPDSTISANADKKNKKASITVCLACNVPGTRRLPLWIIGKAQTPRCFERSSIHIENFPIVWRYNGKAWMTGLMFEEYLRWFDDQMAGRRVCLLLDELCAHETGVALLYSMKPRGLKNTKILLLPTGSSFVRQPLNQGIIRSWKAHYRKRWLGYMLNADDADRNPFKLMNVLVAIRWAIGAWENDVTSAIIRDSWVKSGVLGSNYAPAVAGWKAILKDDTRMFNETVARMEQQLEDFQQRKRIRSAMDIETFFSPVGETVDDNMNDDDEEEGDLSESLAEIYGSGGAQRDCETDEEDVAVAAPIEKREALRLVARLRLYEEQQLGGDGAVIAALNRYERDIQARRRPEGS